MLSLVVSTIVFFVAGFLINRRFKAMDLPKGIMRNLMVFSLSLALAYAAAALVDWVAGTPGGNPGSPIKELGDDDK